MSWKFVPIKDVSIGIYDGPHATPKPSNTGNIFLGIKNISDDGRLDLSEVRKISEEEFSKWTKRVTPRFKDIVFSYEATLHRYAIIPEDFIGCLGRRMALIRPDLNKVDFKFLYYWFFSNQWRRVVNNYIITGSTVDRIPLTNFPDFKIALPPLHTQRRIASILSAYDDLIDNNLKRIKLLEEAAQNIYREWFVEMRFPNHEEAEWYVDEQGRRLPKGWEYKSIGKFGRVVTGKTPSTKNSGYYNGNILFVKTPDMHGNIFVIDSSIKLTKEGAESQGNKSLPPYSVLVSCIGTIGVVALTYKKCQTNQQINGVVTDSIEKSLYLYGFAKTLKPILEGLGSSGATMGNVNKSKFEQIEILIPKFEILTDYSQIVQPMFDSILVCQNMIQKLKEAHEILLPRLMNQTIEV